MSQPVRAQIAQDPMLNADVCVVVDGLEGRAIDVQRELHKVFSQLVRGPVDLLVYDGATFRERASHAVTFEAEIEETGFDL